MGGACAMQGRAVRPLCQRLFADLTWLARNEAILIALNGEPPLPSVVSDSRILVWKLKNLHFTVSQRQKREASLAPFLGRPALPVDGGQRPLSLQRSSSRQSTAPPACVRPGAK